MSKPLSRSNSRGILDDSSESSNAELEKQGNKMTVNPPVGGTSSSGVPSTSSRPLKRTGTWTMAYMPKDKGEEGSEPTVSPRKGVNASESGEKSLTPKRPTSPNTSHLPPSMSGSSQYSASSTSSTSGTSRPPGPSSTSNVPIVSPTPDNVPLTTYLLDELKDKPEGAVLRSDLLAKQVVYALSQGYKSKLDGSMVDSMFRAVVWLRPKLSDDEKTPPSDANLIKRFVEPFMHYYFRTEKFKKCLDTVESNYHGASADATALYSKNAYTFGKSSEAEKIMKPVIQPALDYMCGAEMNVSSTSMPVPVLNFLLSLSDEIKVWHDKNGTGNADTLKTAQKKAVTGCFGTRSFMPDFEASLKKRGDGEGEKKKTYDDEYFRPLTKFMNTYLNTKVENFLESIVECPSDKRKKIQRMANISESHQTFESESVKESHLEKTKKKVLTRKPTLKTQLVDMLGAAVSTSTSSPLSPRGGAKKNVVAVDTASYNEFQSEKKMPEKPINDLGGQLNADKDADFAAKNAKRKKRTKFLVEFNKKFLSTAFGGKLKAGSQKKIADIPPEDEFPEWPKILHDFTKKVVEGSEENYRKFRQDPNAYWASFLSDFINAQRAFGKASSPSLEKLKAAAETAKGVTEESEG